MNQIFNEDCITGMAQLPASSVNLCVTSPPYNLGGQQYKNHIVYNSYQDDVPYQQYLGWIKDVFSEVYRVLTPDGRLCINIGDKQNGEVPTHVYYSNIMENIGFKTYTTIVWNKFQVRSRTAWGSFKSASCPSFPTPFEYILVFHKGQKKLQRTPANDIAKEDFIKWSLPLWDFTPETRMKKMGHPAMFPPELPKRCIQMFSYVGDTVIDPFCGLGTTCLVAKQLGRQYIGYEIDKDYYDKAVDRVK